jgi:predicted kinase
MPPARPGGSLLVMVGLPGAGKSYVVERLQLLVPCLVVTTDRVRLFVRDRPTYTAAEMAYIYEVCYGVVDRRLGRGQRVIFDGSNYLAARRERLFAIAARRPAPFAVCHVQASEEITRQRLARRLGGDRHNGDVSDAGWSVYQWMVEAQEPVAVDHLPLDTTTTPPDDLAARLYQYWMQREREFDSDLDLQPARRSGGYGVDD